MRHKRKACATVPGIVSARQMVSNYGPRALAVSFAMKKTAKTARQRAHWDKVIKTLEGRAKNPTLPKVIESIRLADGSLLRLQKRGKRFDVIRNVGGLATGWRYIKKGVSLQEAHAAFDALSLTSNPIKHGYTVLANGAELATFKTRAHAMEYGRAMARARPTLRVQMRLP